MSVLLICGVATVIGVSGAIWHACTEDDRARERIKQLENENKQLNSAKNYIDGIKTKLCSAKKYLENGKTDFKNGGHVMDDVPLANYQFESCISKLDGAIASANELINDFSTMITKNNNEIRTEQAKLK
ncbi:MAG: hypothetical protein E7170_03380 [Firmicutes bacterium]|nr:hypothetical protein [Bacillota bacterium]